MEVLRLGVELELQLLAYTTATAMQYPSWVCHLRHSSQQLWIPNPLSKARDQTCVLMGASQIHFFCATTGTPSWFDCISIAFILLNKNTAQHLHIENDRTYIKNVCVRKRGKKEVLPFSSNHCQYFDKHPFRSFDPYRLINNFHYSAHPASSAFTFYTQSISKVFLCIKTHF